MVTVAVAVMRGWLLDGELESILASEGYVANIPPAPLTVLCQSNLTYKRCFPQPPSWLTTEQTAIHAVWKEALYQREVLYVRIW